MENLLFKAPDSKFLQLQLRDALPLGEFIKPIAIPQHRLPCLFNSIECYIAGWGDTAINGSVSEVLLWLPMMVLLPGHCQILDSKHRQSEFCAIDAFRNATLFRVPWKS